MSAEPVIIIPSLNPDEALLTLLDGLRKRGCEQIIVVDDGSRPEKQALFHQAQQMGCTITRHEKNRGKGAALKTGMKLADALYKEAGSFVTADGDGQHAPEDILRVCQAAEEHPDALILGTRDLKAPGVPFRNRLGNRFSSWFFRLTCGVVCPDTQSGLRAIPQKLKALALSEDGERYEYEMNFLNDAVKQAPLIFVPVRTIYRKDHTDTHFRPIRDSIRVYGRFLKFTAASLTGALVDYVLFFLLDLVLPMDVSARAFWATVLARFCSGAVNFTMNRVISFRSRSPVGRQMVRYLILFLAQMFLSATLVSLLSRLLWPLLAKLIVDTCLFFISYVIQKNWVFRREA